MEFVFSLSQMDQMSIIQFLTCFVLASIKLQFFDQMA